MEHATEVELATRCFSIGLLLIVLSCEDMGGPVVPSSPPDGRALTTQVDSPAARLSQGFARYEWDGLPLSVGNPCNWTASLLHKVETNGTSLGAFYPPGFQGFLGIVYHDVPKGVTLQELFSKADRNPEDKFRVDGTSTRRILETNERGIVRGEAWAEMDVDAFHAADQIKQFIQGDSFVFRVHVIQTGTRLFSLNLYCHPDQYLDLLPQFLAIIETTVLLSPEMMDLNHQLVVQCQEDSIDLPGIGALLEAGANPNVFHPDIICPMLHAMLKDENTLTKCLLQRGGNPFDNPSGDEAMLIVATFNPVQQALIAKFLEKREPKPKPEEPTKKRRVLKPPPEHLVAPTDNDLLFAVEWGKVDKVKHYLEIGLNPQAVNRDGQTALDLAREQRRQFDEVGLDAGAYIKIERMILKALEE